jgi:5'-nucleotidase
MKRPDPWAFSLPAVAALLVALPGPWTARARAEPIEIVLLHLNDVYEITRPGKRDRGGLTRVATLRKQLLEKNPNTISILAGDFFSPSTLGTVKIDGKRLDGKHMVDILNTLKLDYATFGNHEFDIPEDAFLARLEESRFGWFSGNVTDREGKPFPKVEPYKIIPFKIAGGKEVKLGLIGLTVDTKAKTPKEQYWQCLDYFESGKRQVAELKGKVDILVAVTHLNLPEDRKLAREVPGIDLILGGHEHENNTWRSRTPGVAPIYKADANVRTVYVHHLHFDPATRSLDLESQLLNISNLIPEDKETADVTDKWVDRAFTALQTQTHYDPREKVVTTTDDLEGREDYVRRQPTNLTTLLGKSLLHSFEGADLAFYNSGTVRVDDLIPAGPVTFYDVLRILPYGGDVWGVEVKGSLLQKLFDKGLSPALYGSGGFLHTINVESAGPGKWKIQGRPLDPDRAYKAATTDHLALGRDATLSFFKKCDEMKPLEAKADVRDALVKELRKAYGSDEKPAVKPTDRPAPSAEAPKRTMPIDALIGLVVAGALLLGALYAGWRMRKS